MENIKFTELLLETAFSVMACDGDIDPQEIKLIRELDNNENLFQMDDLDSKLDSLLERINKEGQGFLKTFFNNLEKADLNKEQELKLVDTAIKMIEADDIILFSELKFFKIIKSYISLTDEEILEKFSHVNDIEDYVAQDIFTENYLEKITSDYFNNQALPTFKSISELEKLIKDKNE